VHIQDHRANCPKIQPGDKIVTCRAQEGFGERLMPEEIPVAGGHMDGRHGAICTSVHPSSVTGAFPSRLGDRLPIRPAVTMSDRVTLHRHRYHQLSHSHDVVTFIASVEECLNEELVGFPLQLKVWALMGKVKVQV
jgi:hypothetical protein